MAKSHNLAGFLICPTPSPEYPLAEIFQLMLLFPSFSDATGYCSDSSTRSFPDSIAVSRSSILVMSLLYDGRVFDVYYTSMIHHTANCAGAARWPLQSTATSCLAVALAISKLFTRMKRRDLKALWCVRNGCVDFVVLGWFGGGSKRWTFSSFHCTFWHRVAGWPQRNARSVGRSVVSFWAKRARQPIGRSVGYCLLFVPTRRNHLSYYAVLSQPPPPPGPSAVVLLCPPRKKDIIGGRTDGRLGANCRQSRGHTGGSDGGAGWVDCDK